MDDHKFAIKYYKIKINIEEEKSKKIKIERKKKESERKIKIKKKVKKRKIRNNNNIYIIYTLGSFGFITSHTYNALSHEDAANCVEFGLNFKLLIGPSTPSKISNNLDVCNDQI